MKARTSLAVVVLVATACVASFSGCSDPPEDFCTGYVEEVCEVLTGCCIDGASFDRNGCVVQMTSFCQSTMRVEEVHAGGVVFDSGAASTCIGTIETCEDFVSPATPEDDVANERFVACQRVVTGFRPVGSGCESNTQCAVDGGDYPVCHNGVCARAIISEESRCSFSFETLELFVCPVGFFCDLADVELDPDAPPSQNQFEFDAPCVSAHKSGEACDDGIACGAGLYCAFDGDASECRSLVGDGGDCSGGEQCGVNLTCNGESCERTQRPYCYEPGANACGDGACGPGEDIDNCPEDCGGAFCGDGFCDLTEEDIDSCPEDCGGACGDGFCDIDEDIDTCPDDCGGACGDGFCDPGEGSCIEDCCGDGICEAGEGEPAVCPADCCGDGFCDPGEDDLDCPDDCA